MSTSAPMEINRKLIAAFVMPVTLLGAQAAFAQNYPAKPVRIITAGAGTFHDIATRHLAQRLGERWNQAVVVENQPAAGLTIGTGMAARAAPDGYTLVMADRTSLAAAPSLYKGLSYDPARDLAPITLVAVAPLMMAIHPSIPASNLREFVDYARRQSSAMPYGSAGPATVSHIAGELFRHLTGVDLTPVHYKGGGAAVAALLGGEVKVSFGNVPNFLPHVGAGRIKALAVMSAKRFPGAPEVPTAAEAGLPGFEAEQWVGMLAPARTPSAIVEKLNHDMVEVLRSPAMREAMRAQGAEAAPGTPQQFTAFIASEAAKARQIIEISGVRLN